jgi:hypothetical protein
LTTIPDDGIVVVRVCRSRKVNRGYEIDAFVDFLSIIIDNYGPSSSRYSPKRIRLSVEPGDKYTAAPPEPGRLRSRQKT